MGELIKFPKRGHVERELTKRQVIQIAECSRSTLQRWQTPEYMAQFGSPALPMRRTSWGDCIYLLTEVESWLAEHRPPRSQPPTRRKVSEGGNAEATKR
jgi:hypothetical protein